MHILQDFNLIGKPLNSNTLLELLHFIEGDSKSYYKQKHKIYDSIRINGNSIWYQGQYCFLSFNFELDRKKLVKNIYGAFRTMVDYF